MRLKLHCNYVYLIYIIYLFLLPERDNARRLFHARLVDLLLHVLVFIFFSMKTHCTRKVIGGELQERLIPVPYSKTSTDQAVRFLTGEMFRCFTHINLFFVFIYFVFFNFLFVCFYTLYSVSIHLYVPTLVCSVMLTF